MPKPEEKLANEGKAVDEDKREKEIKEISEPAKPKFKDEVEDLIDNVLKSFLIEKKDSQIIELATKLFNDATSPEEKKIFLKNYMRSAKQKMI